jgi:hypothetical protein
MSDTEAKTKVFDAICRGIAMSGVSIGASVFPNIAGCVEGFLFDQEYRGFVRAYCDERDAADKAAISKIKS